ncbi:MAG: hypothetical protein ACFFB3_19980 [Candidatus Hodarchaeota archaeon]
MNRKKSPHLGISLFAALILLLGIMLAANAMADENGDNDEENSQIFGEDGSKRLGIIAGPLLFLGGSYVLFMWTRRLQSYLLVEWGDLIGLNSLDEDEVQAAQRMVRKWLLWAHIAGMGLAFIAASIHGYNLYLNEGFFEGGVAHLMIWPALLAMLLYMLSGLDLKFRFLPSRIRRRIRPLHKHPILILLLASIILGHALLIDE